MESQIQTQTQTPEYIRYQIAHSIGAKATIYFRAPDGVKTSASHLTIQGPPQQYGYINPRDGWSRHCPEGRNYPPSYRFLARRTRHKKNVWVRTDNVIGFKFGW